MTSPRRREVIRPRLGRWVAETFAVLVVAAFAGAAVIAPGGSDGYGALDRAALAGLGCAIGFVVHRLGDVRVVVTEQGLDVVNPLRRRHVPWWQVRGVRLEPGDPWLVLHLVDDETLQAMGVQGSDGAYAREQALRIARHVAGHRPQPGA